MDTPAYQRALHMSLEQNDGCSNLEQSILSIEQGTNPDGRCVCDFGKLNNLGKRVIHVLIAIAWECRNGSIEKKPLWRPKQKITKPARGFAIAGRLSMPLLRQ